jgi:quercetin dioxygenase-like cupin family protein
MWKQVCLTVLFYAVASAAAAPSLPEMRMTPAEIRGSAFNGSRIGSSGLSEVRTKVLFGDPAKAGFYSILLYVPMHTMIQAHSHRDDRIATVVSGEWQFGYGSRFDEKALKTLSPGSVYSEPGGVNHFAQTGNALVVVQISGYGPSDTRYFDPANDPALKQKN